MAGLIAQAQQNHRKRFQKAAKTRETQRNKSNSSSINERYLASDSDSFTDRPANTTLFDSFLKAACQSSERRNRSRPIASGTTTMKSEPRRNASSSHCRDVGAHIQSRSHVGLGERLKEAWKSALPNKGKCEGCYRDTLITRLIFTPCDHKYCPNCVCKMASLAMREKSLFPVRCCGNEIPTKHVSSVLNVQERKAYLSRIDEQEVPPGDRWYCPHPNCGLWIHPRNLTTRSKPLKCPHCRVVICFKCRDMAHEDRECAVDDTILDILAVARQYRWQRCYRCHTLVEKTDGCTHMRCHCSAQFCYGCGGPHPCHCNRSVAAAAREDARRLQEDGDLDLTTIVAAMEQADREEQDIETARQQRDRFGLWASGGTDGFRPATRPT